MRVSALALAAGVSAITVSPRDTSTILSDITNIDTQVKSLTTAVNDYTSIAQAESLISAEQSLESAIKQGTSDAQATTGPISDSDTSSVLMAIRNLIPDIVTALNAVVAKSGTFTSTGVASVVSMDLTNLKSDTDQFGSALVSLAPQASQAVASAALSCIDQAFVAAEATSSASADCTTAIVIGGGSSPTTTGASTSSATASESASSSGSGSTSSSGSSAPATTSGPASSKSSNTSLSGGSVSVTSTQPSGVATNTGTGVVSTPTVVMFTGAANSLKGGLSGAVAVAGLALAL